MQFLRNIATPFKRTPQRGFLSFLPGTNHDLQRYCTTVEIPYTQQITVGVEASSEEQARQLIHRAYHGGTLLNNTATMPTLQNAFEPNGDNATPQILRFEEVDEFPPPDASVMQTKCLASSYSLLSICRAFDHLVQGAESNDAISTITVTSELANRLHQVVRGLDGF